MAQMQYPAEGTKHDAAPAPIVPTGTSLSAPQHEAGMGPPVYSATGTMLFAPHYGAGLGPQVSSATGASLFAPQHGAGMGPPVYSATGTLLFAPHHGAGSGLQLYPATYTNSCAILLDFKAYAQQEQVVMDTNAGAMQPSGDPSSNVPCPHGCGSLIPEGQYAKHQRFCSHRPTVHPFCGQFVKMSDFEQRSKFCKGRDVIPKHSQHGHWCGIGDRRQRLL